jgi:REP-associated tyrosine transposase
MPRRARFTSLPPAGVYHVTHRGVARQSIAADDHDRRAFVAFLNGARRQNDWQLLAYCLMPNHFHLVVISALERLSRGMHFLGFRYAQRFNERHDRAGHLFQGRFRARSVSDGEDVSTVCAYVFENPVRATLCSSAGEWPWSGGELVRDYAVAWTGERAGAHEHSGDTSPLRPFRRR